MSDPPKFSRLLSRATGFLIFLAVDAKTCAPRTFMTPSDDAKLHFVRLAAGATIFSSTNAVGVSEYCLGSFGSWNKWITNAFEICLWERSGLASWGNFKNANNDRTPCRNGTFMHYGKGEAERNECMVGVTELEALWLYY